MDRDKISAAANKVKGAVKQAVGRFTGDAKLEASGHADKAKGAAQGAAGEAKDKARETLDKKS
jgi:uncharacterized protein YjbJ (UPF0337 family)